MRKVFILLFTVLMSNLAFSQTIYVFNGNGKWSDSTNWLNKIMPPAVLDSGSQIIINPFGDCILDIPQIVSRGALFTIQPGKNLVVNEEFNVIDPNKDADDTLSKENIAFLDTIGAPNPTLQQMLGYDGNSLGRPAKKHRETSLGTQGVLSKLIDDMLRDAQSLSGQKIILYPDEGVNKPRHLGLVYSFGQRNFTARLSPNCTTDCDAFHKKYGVYGTDCTGLMFNLIINAGVSITLPIQVSTFESKLKAALASGTFKDIKIKNLGFQTADKIKSGDFIVWQGHIGIICDLGNLGKTVFQSNGDPTPGSESEQIRNLGSGRGVHPLDFIKATTGINYWGINYKILRLEEDSTFTDPRDGQQYPYKTIGTQVWMTKNLNYAASGSSCYDNNAANCATYGRLYDWNKALTVAPPGWHLPSDAEWTILTNNLGGYAVAGGKMKSTTGWNTPNAGATNSSGFAGLPGGYRYNFSTFRTIGYNGYWWSSTTYDANYALLRYLYYNDALASREDFFKTNGFSVRCVRD